MGIGSLLYVLRKRWRVSVLCVVLGLAVAGLLFALSPKMYQASATIFVSTSGESSAGADLANGNTFVQARVQSYVSVISSPQVLNAVAANQSIGLSANQLKTRVSADAPLNKVIINVHATDDKPDRATLICNAVADQFSSIVEDIERPTDSSSPSLVKLTVIQPATTPNGPVSPSSTLYFGLGLLLGIVAGAAAALGREAPDRTMKSDAEIEQTVGAPVMASIPWERTAGAAPIAIRSASASRRSEAFRQLRTNLQFINVDNPPRVIAVTSALPGEGKSHTAVNLAAALAEAGSRVCLVEADLRRPTIGARLGLIQTVGLTTVLTGQAPLEECLQNGGMNLAILTAGPLPPNPTELLSSAHCSQIIEDLAARVDYVIVDTAPLLPVADGALIAALADATLLVVRTEKTSRPSVDSAAQTLSNVGVVPVGVVSSMLTAKARDEAGYYYYAGSQVTQNEVPSEHESGLSSKHADA